LDWRLSNCKFWSHEQETGPGPPNQPFYIGAIGIIFDPVGAPSLVPGRLGPKSVRTRVLYNANPEKRTREQPKRGGNFKRSYAFIRGHDGDKLRLQSSTHVTMVERDSTLFLIVRHTGATNFTHRNLSVYFPVLKSCRWYPRGVTRRLHVLLGVVCRIVDCSTTSQSFLMMELNGRYHLIVTEPFTSCCGKKGRFFELIGQHPRCSELLQTVLDSRSTLDFLLTSITDTPVMTHDLVLKG
jgi:hypothetical protein